MIAKSNNSFSKIDDKAVFKEYLTNNHTLDICQISVNGRYPKNGLLRNNRCTVAIYCISGTAKVELDGKIDNVKRGDVIILNVHSKYYINGKDFVGVFASTPMYNKEQQEIIVQKEKTKK